VEKELAGQGHEFATLFAALADKKRTVVEFIHLAISFDRANGKSVFAVRCTSRRGLLPGEDCASFAEVDAYRRSAAAAA
jgi:hypothetical protein